jgi:hypothetical protein
MFSWIASSQGVADDRAGSGCMSFLAVNKLKVVRVRMWHCGPGAEFIRHQAAVGPSLGETAWPRALQILAPSFLPLAPLAAMYEVYLEIRSKFVCKK